MPQFDDAQVFERMQAVFTTRCPKLKIAYKDKSWAQRFIGLLLRFTNPTYLTNVGTTWGQTIYFPSADWVKQNTRAAWIMLAHEYIHAYDASKRGNVLFDLGYAWPTLLAALALLAPLGLVFWPLWGLVLFAVVLKLPSEGRLNDEVRAYIAQMAAEWWAGDIISFNEISTYAGWLSSSMYLWAARTPDVAQARLVAGIEAIQNGTFLTQAGAEPYTDIAEALSQARALARPMRGTSAVAPRY